MSDDMTARLEAMLERDADNPTLRYALASRHLEAGRPDAAIEHARLAVDLKPDYSAAWRVLGRAQAEAGLFRDAAATFERGIEVAARLGDRQAEKEMQVFLKRARKQAS